MPRPPPSQLSGCRASLRFSEYCGCELEEIISLQEFGSRGRFDLSVQDMLSFQHCAGTLAFSGEFPNLCISSWEALSSRTCLTYFVLIYRNSLNYSVPLDTDHTEVVEPWSRPPADNDNQVNQVVADDFLALRALSTCSRSRVGCVSSLHPCCCELLGERSLASYAQTALAAGHTMDRRMERAWGEEKTSHAFTARMCAASRYLESQRPDSLFVDPLAPKLAGPQGMAQPMGAWIMVPRTRFGDDLVRHHYTKRSKPCRQLVLLGAGMDSRAFRLRFPELRVFEVDLPILFDEKEPLLQDEPISVFSRTVVPTDFSSTDDWTSKLLSFSPSHVD
eukprot:s1482_g10.t2